MLTFIELCILIAILAGFFKYESCGKGDRIDSKKVGHGKTGHNKSR